MNVQEELDSRYNSFKNHETFVVTVTGSQNYGLDDENSDIDTKSYVFPNFQEIAEGSQLLSEELMYQDGSHNVVKDVRLLTPMLEKCNINFVESLFTDYYKVNPLYEKYWNALLDYKYKIAEYDREKMAMSAYGCLLVQDKKVQKASEKGEVNGKALSNVLRMHYFIIHYLNGNSFDICIKPFKDDRDRLMRIKRNKTELTPEEAIRISTSNKNASFAKIEKTSFQPPSQDLKYYLEFVRNELMYEYIKNHIKE